MKGLLSKMEKFNLSWNGFSESAANTIKDLLQDQDFADVTLVCDDNRQLKTHKVVISSCSSFFRNLLKNNPHQHPLIYLKGLKFPHLQSLLQFVYLGQAEVQQDSLEDFMRSAQDLQISGLSESDSGFTKNEPVNCRKPDVLEIEKETTIQRSEYFQPKPNAWKGEQSSEDVGNMNGVSYGSSEIAVSDDSITEYFNDRHEFVEEYSHTKPNIGKFQCEQCNYGSSSTFNLRRHIMSKHEGVTYPCSYCDYKAMQTGHLKTHIRNVHSPLV